MKLIYCPKCQDIIKLRLASRECWCGLSYGRYCDNGIDAVIGGEAVPIGFANESFAKALENQPQEGMGLRFEAFIIPKICPTVKLDNRRAGLDYGAIVFKTKSLKDNSPKGDIHIYAYGDLTRCGEQIDSHWLIDYPDKKVTCKKCLGLSAEGHSEVEKK